jgi:PiT family inorganic phosphate transporter
MSWVIATAALFLAFSNGANDNFKGFATVWGAHALSYRNALLLATFATIAGSIFSLLLAGELVRAFSGAGLVPDSVAAAPHFMAAVAIGASVTVITATRTGFPISTTHAILGAMVGAGFAASGSSLDLYQLGNRFVLPLLLSPVLAAACGMLVHQGLRRRQSDADCLCLVEGAVSRPIEGEGASALQTISGLPSLVVASEQSCETIPVPAARLTFSMFLDRAHIFSAATICFARSVNDTPKLAALLLGARISGISSMVLVGAAMAFGGLILARRVAETMSLRLNTMDARQGVSANLITAGLVLLASRYGLPVSTTHVSVGSIAGVGLGAGTTNWSVLRNVLLSWAATLPLAGLAAWLAAMTLMTL